MAILEDEQIQGIMLSLAQVRGERSFTEAEANQVVEWATEAVVEYTLFQGVLNGDMYIDINDKGECVFGITDQGAQMATSLVLGAGNTH